MFKMMKSSHIGLHHPEFFLHWASFEIKADRRDRSLAVLASSEDVPIMRGNFQIKSAKEAIESGNELVLESLYKINTQPPSTQMLTPSASISSMMMKVDFRSAPSIEDLDDKLMKLRRSGLGLGPPKRVKEDFTTETPLISSVTNEHHTNQSNNSNMSLTMTEINVGIIQPMKADEQEEYTSTLLNDTVTTKALQINNENINFNNTNNNNISGNVNGMNNSFNGNINVIKNTNTNYSNNFSKTAPTAILPTTNAAPRSRQVRVNGKIYRVLQLIGRGGSSKVFRVINGEGHIFALKKVNLKNLDEATLSSYTNEIGLLKSFAKNPHIIQLVDSEMNKEQGCLYILMEYGEVDLGKMLKARIDAGQTGDDIDENFIRFSFQQV